MTAVRARASQGAEAKGDWKRLAGLIPSTERDQPMARLGEFSSTDRLTDQFALQGSLPERAIPANEF